jgi:phage tail protein X
MDVSVDCVTSRVYGDMTEHSCYVYEDGELVNALTVRVYYHRTRITAKIVSHSVFEAKAWRVFEKALSEELSRVMPKPSDSRVVNNILKEFFEGLATS